LPASLDALPPFNAIIRQCWNQRDLRRPTAQDVHRLLADLLARVTLSSVRSGQAGTCEQAVREVEEEGSKAGGDV
jgi:hypothetical protein